MALPFRRELFEITDEKPLTDLNAWPELGELEATAGPDVYEIPLPDRGTAESSDGAAGGEHAGVSGRRSIAPRLVAIGALLTALIAGVGFYRDGEPDQRPVTPREKARASDPREPAVPERRASGARRRAGSEAQVRRARPTHDGPEVGPAPPAASVGTARIEVRALPSVARPTAAPAPASPLPQSEHRSHEFNFER